MRSKVTSALLLALLAILLAAAGASAHGGKSHRLLGTVKAIHVTVATADGKERIVRLTPATKYERAGKPARLADVGVGSRVAIQLSEDDKAALRVKIGQAAAGR